MLTPIELIKAGYDARFAGRPADAKRAFESAIEMLRSGDDRSSLAQALMGLGQIERDCGNSTIAERDYVEAIEILRALGEPLRLAHALRHAGDILTERGELEAAVPYFEEALVLYRTRGDVSRPLDVANAIMGYARLRQARGDDDMARSLILEAHEMYSGLEITAGVDECNARLARLRD